MTKNHYFSLPIISFTLILSAHAEIFTCKDSTNHVITSDRPVPECADKSTQVYTNNGVIKEKLAAAKTPEQQRLAAIQEQQRAKEAMQEAQIQKEQRYLIAHYPTEQDLDSAQQRAIDEINAKLEVEQLVVKTTTEMLTTNRNAQKLVPKDQHGKLIELRNKEEDLMQTLKQSNLLINRFSSEEARIEKKFNETRKRYKELVGSRGK